MSPVNLPLASSDSPKAVEEESQESPTSHVVDHSVYDVSYDSDSEIKFTSTKYTKFSTAVLDSDEDSKEEIHSENESLMAILLWRNPVNPLQKWTKILQELLSGRPGILILC